MYQPPFINFSDLYNLLSKPKLTWFLLSHLSSVALVLNCGLIINLFVGVYLCEINLLGIICLA